MKELLIKFLSKTQNKTEEEIKELLFNPAEDGKEPVAKPDAFNILIKAEEERIKNIKEGATGKTKEAFDNGYKKAEKEVLSKLETEVKTKYSHESDLQGVDLIDDIVTKLSKSKLSDDQVKVHPLFLKLENQIKTEFVPKTEFEKVKSEKEEYISKAERDKILSQVRAKALEIFRKQNPVLSEDAVKRANQEEMFLRLNVDNGNYQLSDGNIIMVDSEGKRIENNLGHAVNFDEYISDTTKKNFDIKVQDGAGNAGNSNNNGGGQGVKMQRPKDSIEFNTALRSLAGKDLVEYYDLYSKEFSG